jgi:hypothetical protein
MPRYFYSLSNATKVNDYPDGMVLPDLQAARAHAIIVARELAANKSQIELQGLTLAVSDSAGREVLEFLLAEIPDE